MTDRCPRAFDETLISGHLDGELTQSAEQKVRLHLEDCGFCSRLYDELEAMRLCDGEGLSQAEAGDRDVVHPHEERTGAPVVAGLEVAREPGRATGGVRARVHRLPGRERHAARGAGRVVRDVDRPDVGRADGHPHVVGFGQAAPVEDRAGRCHRRARVYHRWQEQARRRTRSTTRSFG